MTRRIWIAAAVIILTGIIAYWNSFNGVFVYDDHGSIRENPHIRTLWPLSESMSLPFINGGQTVARRPMLSLSFALNHHFFGPEEWGYHLVNLVIHLCAGLLLFGIVRRAFESYRWQGKDPPSTGLALAISLIWVVHPLQTESVTYIVQRAESLMGMLFLLTLYCSLRGFQSNRARFWYVAAIAACAAGIAVKEVMFTAPLIVFLYDGIFVSTSFRSAWQTRRRFYLALAATWTILVYLQSIGWEESSKDFTNRSPLAYALTQPGAILYYLRLSIFPTPLVMDYNWPTAASFLAIVPPGVVLFGLLIVTAYGVYRRLWFGFVGAWFFLILGPSSSFAALSQNLEEHRMYLSLAACVVVYVFSIYAALQRMMAGHPPARIKTTAAILTAACVVLMSIGTIRRNADYRSELGLWQDNVEKRPSSYAAQNSFGSLLQRQGELDRAILHLREAIRINPEEPMAHYNLGFSFFQKRNWPEAITHFRQATVLNPKYVEAHDNLGNAYYNLRQWNAAIVHYDRAIAIKPDFAKSHHNLGSAYFEKGDYDRAIKHYQESIALKPDYVLAHVNLGNALFRLNQLDDAIKQYQQALGIDAQFWPAHVGLAKVYINRSQRSRALQHLRAAAQFQPNSQEIRQLLREAINQSGAD